MAKSFVKQDDIRPEAMARASCHTYLSNEHRYGRSSFIFLFGHQ